MEGKVKYVKRCISHRGQVSDSHKSDVHAIRITSTNAILYNGDEVCIDESEIRAFYNRINITRPLIDKLSNSLHNVWIKYSEGEDGNYWLDNSLDEIVK